MASCPVRAEQVLEGHGRPLRTTLSSPSDCAKYEIALDVALHFGPEDHSCAEKLNKNNDQVGRETLQLFKSGQATHARRPAPAEPEGDRYLVPADRTGLESAAHPISLERQAPATAAKATRRWTRHQRLSRSH